jgi:hypothetical protein
MTMYVTAQRRQGAMPSMLIARKGADHARKEHFYSSARSSSPLPPQAKAQRALKSPM